MEIYSPRITGSLVLSGSMYVDGAFAAPMIVGLISSSAQVDYNELTGVSGVIATAGIDASGSIVSVTGSLNVVNTGSYQVLDLDGYRVYKADFVHTNSPSVLDLFQLQSGSAGSLKILSEYSGSSYYEYRWVYSANNSYIRSVYSSVYPSASISVTFDTGSGTIKSISNKNTNISGLIDVFGQSIGVLSNESQITSTLLEYLVVAGGGGGGSFGGGGGAGGFRNGVAVIGFNTSYTYMVTVGAGGAGATTSDNGVNGVNGSNSMFALLPSDDPYFDSVSLLLHMDGANGSTTFTDNSINNFTVTRFGNSQISTAQSVFGGASGYFDGSGDYLSITTDDAFQFGTGDFTVEAWVYLTANLSTSSGGYLTDFRNGSSNNFALGFIGNAGVTKMYQYANGIDKIGSGIVTLNTWHHAAWVRNNSTVTMYLNGTSNGTFTNSYSQNITNVIISSRYTGTQEYIPGYIDDLRITKGVARYTTDFTPPTTPFPDSNFLIKSAGGGGGGTRFGSAQSYVGNAGNSGGSGGGGANSDTAYNAPGGAGNTPSTSPSQGNNGGVGGAGTAGTPSYSHGGGGGAGSVGDGGRANTPAGSNGGDGLPSLITGTEVYYAGGGGGGVYTTGTIGIGGNGGGGNGGGNYTGAPNATSGEANLGGGGGGGAYTGGPVNTGPGGNGGAGVVIIKFLSIFNASISAGLAYEEVDNNDAGTTVIKFTAGTGTVTIV